MDEVIRALVELLAHHDTFCALGAAGRPCGHPATSDTRSTAVLRARALVEAAMQPARSDRS